MRDQYNKAHNDNYLPDVSVVLPFFKAKNTLGEAIKSLSRQSFENFECLLVDNNSGDGSREVALEWTRRDSRFTLISESRQGVVFASNTGWEHSRGRYIARMDADDIAQFYRLEEQSGFLDANPGYGAVGGLAEYISHFPYKRGFSKYVEWNNLVISYQEILRNRFIDSPIINPTAMWRREVAERHGMYTFGDYPEDYEMWLRWLHGGVKICKIPTVVLKWYDNAERLTRTHQNYSDEAFYRVKTHYLAKWLERYNPFYPKVLVWGASRISRARADLLESYGIRIIAYVDIKRTRQLKKDVIYYQDLPEAGHHFILIYVRQWHAKEQIKHVLSEKGYCEGVDYLLAS